MTQRPGRLVLTGKSLINCQRKKRYRSEEEARNARAKYIKQYGESDTKVYNCPVCFGWHLTRKYKGNENIYI